MAIVLFRVDPAKAPTWGGTLVSIFGDGFPLPEVPPPGAAPAPPAPPTVRVEFGGAIAPWAAAVASNRVLARVPPSPAPRTLVVARGRPALTFDPGPPARIVRAAGSWLDDGFFPGAIVTVEGSDANDGEFEIATVGASDLTLASSATLAAEGPTASARAFSRSYGEATVDLRVVALDASGNPIPGEEATLAGAFRFERPSLARGGILRDVAAALVSELRRAVVPEVALAPHPDFVRGIASTEDARKLGVGSFPALALLGPTIRQDGFRREARGPLAASPFAGDPGELARSAAARPVRLEFVVVGLSDSTQELLALAEAFEVWRGRAPRLRVEVEGTEVEYEIAPRLDAELAFEGRRADGDPLRSFAGVIEVEGVELWTPPGLPEAWPVDVAPDTVDTSGEAGARLLVGAK